MKRTKAVWVAMVLLLGTWVSAAAASTPAQAPGASAASSTDTGGNGYDG